MSKMKRYFEEVAMPDKGDEEAWETDFIVLHGDDTTAVHLNIGDNIFRGSAKLHPKDKTYDDPIGTWLAVSRALAKASEAYRHAAMTRVDMLNDSKNPYHAMAIESYDPRHP